MGGSYENPNEANTQQANQFLTGQHTAAEVPDFQTWVKNQGIQPRSMGELSNLKRQYDQAVPGMQAAAEAEAARLTEAAGGGYLGQTNRGLQQAQGAFMGSLNNVPNLEGPSQYEPAINAALQGAYGQAGSFRPGAGAEQFMNYAPAFQQIAMGNFSPLTQGLNQQAANQANTGIRNAATRFSGQGALHSGAAQAAMGEAAMRPFADVQNQLGMAQAGLAGNLMNTSLPQFFGGEQFRTQAGMEAANMDLGARMNLAQMGQSAQAANQQAALQRSAMLGDLTNMYGGLYGQGAGMMMGFGDPTYTYRPGVGDYIMQGLGAAGNLIPG